MEGMDYLKKKLALKRPRVITRYAYYDMKNRVTEMKGIIPKEMRWTAYSLGWCAKAVDSIADRLVFDKFINDDLKLNQIFRLNNADILFQSCILSALISSCCFIYIGKDENNYPFLQVIDGSNATGEIDPVTNMLTEGYAVLERDKNGKPELEAYFTPYQTQYFRYGKIEDELDHKAPYALLVPVINRPDAMRPFGHSRISRACMDITQAVVRTLRRSEVAAEFYSFPQKYALGLSQDAEFNKYGATFSSFLSFPKDEDGDRPTVGQFTPASMTPFTEQMKTFASLFAGETGLTIDDLGFATANPSSYDAIRASHEQLRLACAKAQQVFGSCFLNAGYLAACLRDNYPYKRLSVADTMPLWLPVFKPDANSLAAIADAIFKINESLPGFIGRDNIQSMTGIQDANELGER